MEAVNFPDEDEIFQMKGYSRVHFPDDKRVELESKHNLFVDDKELDLKKWNTVKLLL